MIDFERGAKSTGSKFYFLTDEHAQLQWKTLTWMIDYHTARGYTFVIPPTLINKKAAEASCILPHFEDDVYKTTDGLYLIPTAEKSLVAMHMDEIIPLEDLPIRYVAVSQCFRREAGSHGSKDKGIKRVHEFAKVELFEITTQETSESAHDAMVNHVCGMIDEMGLVYRTIELPDDDRPEHCAKTVDVELLVGGEWLEVSSISNTLDRQSKIAQIRYRQPGIKKPQKCHLLNGSGVAMPRLMMAMLEKEGKSI